MVNTLTSTLEIKQIALLEIDNVILGFPQSHILAIESLSNVNSLQTTEKSSGTVPFASSEIPVYTFNNDLTLMDKPTANNRFCIAIKHTGENEPFAIMCNAVTQYTIDDNTNIHAMPSLMFNPDSPVIGLVKKDDALVFISTAESMHSYLYLQEDL